MASPLTFHNYQDYLRERFNLIKARRPDFSQGAFARLIGLRANRFSELMSGRQGLSRPAATLIAQKLALSHEETEFFCDLVTARSGRSRLDRDAAAKRIADGRAMTIHEPLSPEIFLTVSDWFYFAILELLQAGPLTGLRLAERLSLPPDRVAEALQKLSRLGFVCVLKGKWVTTRKPFQVLGGTPSAPIRRFHAQVLDRAKIALDKVPVEEREYSTLFLRTNPKKLPWVKKRIAEFWAEIERELEKDENRSQLYALGVQYFPLEHAPSDSDNRDPSGNPMS